jgi:hypothetical protein
LWRLFHREQESYWLLLITIPGWLALVAAIAGGLARELTTSWQPLIVLAAFTHQLLWGAAIAVVDFGLVRHWRVFLASVLVAVFAVLTQLSLYVAGNGGQVGLVVLQANLRVGSADPAALVASSPTTMSTSRPPRSSPTPSETDWSPPA